MVAHGDYIFVDGNANSIEVLSKSDLSLIGTLNTNGSAIFSIQIVGHKLFAGCSGNNLFVYELPDGQQQGFKRIKELKSTSIVYSFCLLDYNTLLCGQRDGALSVVPPNNLAGKVLTFNLGSCGHIIQVSKTSRLNEVIMACSRGLFFAQISDVGEVKVTLNSKEVYLREQDVKAAIEYKRDMVAACMDLDSNVYLIDRKAKTVTRTIPNPSGSDNPLCMRLLPSFDLEKLPFALLRDKDGLSIINLKSGSAFRALVSWYQQLPFPQMLLEVQKAGEALELYVIEYNGRDSTLVRYEASGDFLGGLRVLASNDLM